MLPCRGGQAPQAAGAPAEPAAAEDEVGAGAAPGDSDASLAADTTFAPVNTLAWEERIMWEGAPRGAESEHETDDEGAGPAQAAPAAAQQQQWAQPGDGAADQAMGEAGGYDAGQWGQPAGGEAQQDGYAAQADIAALFDQQQAAPMGVAQQQQPQQQQQQQQQFDNGLPMVLGGGGAALPMVQPQGGAAAAPLAWQPALGGELPGLTSVTAAEMEARAAAESDEEEFWSLPTAPLLRLEQLYQYQRQQAAAMGLEAADRRPLLPAPDMLPGAHVRPGTRTRLCTGRAGHGWLAGWLR